MPLGLILIIALIIVVWWLLNQNAKSAKDDAPVIHDSAVDAPEEVASEDVESAEPSESAVESDGGEGVGEPTEDDLAIIEGIGPKIKSILYDAGIKSFAELADKKPEELKTLLTEAGLRLGDPTTWPEQAKLAASGDTEALEKLQEQLKGGRLVSE